MDAALRRGRLTLTGLLKRVGISARGEGSIPCVQTDKRRLTELKVEQRKHRRELVETWGISSVSAEAARKPVLDWSDPVLKRVVAKADTCGKGTRNFVK